MPLKNLKSKQELYLIVVILAHDQSFVHPKILKSANIFIKKLNFGLYYLKSEIKIVKKNFCYKCKDHLGYYQIKLLKFKSIFLLVHLHIET